jgi:anti-sigma-K factor RskA
MSQQPTLSETHEDLLLAYALGVLSADEMQQLSVLLKERPELRKELAEMRQVADVLPYALPDSAPSADLRQRVIDRAMGVETPVTTPVPALDRRAWWRGPWVAALSAGLAAVLLALTIMLQAQSETQQATIQNLQAQLGEQQVANSGLQTQLSQQQGLNTTLQGQLAARQAALQQLQEKISNLETSAAEREALIAMLTTPNLRVSMGSGNSGNVTLVRAGTNDAVVAHLPPLQPGRTYQLWLIKDAQSAPSSAGTFTVDTQGHGMLVLNAPLISPNEASIFAVTDEPAGGSPAPTTNVLVSGQTTQS